MTNSHAYAQAGAAVQPLRLAGSSSISVPDSTPLLKKLFAEAEKTGGDILIPPGEYFLPGTAPILLASNTRVTATGAHFRLPARLGASARVVLFQGENIRDFSWTGGTFHGHCFNPAEEQNGWEPSTSTRAILLTTSPGGTTENVTFQNIQSEGMAGAAISVFGVSKSESEVHSYARNVVVENCSLLSSGNFMWDYGYLWQVMVWPEEHTAAERAMAAKYFPAGYIHSGLTIKNGTDRILLDNGKGVLRAERAENRKFMDSRQYQDAVTFYGDALPKNVVRGKLYYIVESNPDGIKIAETPTGPPLVFDGDGGAGLKLTHNMHLSYWGLYGPVGGGPGKGALDIVAGDTVRISGCRLSARGDTMHIQRSRNIVFNGNQITGSRMGAFFLAEYCKNAVISGNTVDGTNGSRVISVEKSCEDVTITGNTFRNGGRGSWINQPRNLVIQGNVFVNNTTKGEANSRRGRRSTVTGGYDTFPEMYVTLHEPNGRYDSVIIRDNIFDTGPSADGVLAFAKNGSRISVTGNILKGPSRTIKIEPGCTDVVVRDNVGAQD